MLLTTLRNAVRGKNKDILYDLLINSKGGKMSSSVADVQKQKQQVKTNPTKGDKPIVLRKERQQQAAKKKAVPYIPGTVTLQILGGGSNGSPASVYLFTDQSRYLFNCGEGTQRLAHEHKTKLARLEQIFVTRNTWPTIGGIPGLALTVQDAGVKELSLHGPPYLDNILMSMKRFVVLKTLQLKTVDCTKTFDFEDSVMTVKNLPLYRTPQNGEVTEEYPSQDSVVISYICTLKPRPGPLNLEKCVEHGVPPGPLLGLLKNGIDVTLENGTLVKSADVSEANENPLSFIFLDIPSVEFLGNLEKHNDLLVNAKINPDNSPELALVIHFAPIEVLNNNVYKTFLEKFAPSTQHIFLNSSQNTFSGYIAAHRIQYQLNQLNPKVFPILSEATQTLAGLNSKIKKTRLEDDVAAAENEKDGLSRYSECSGFEQRLNDLSTMSIYHLRPRKGLDRTSEAKLQPNEYINETQILADFPPMLEKLQADLKNRTSLQSVSAKFPIITFLGTGSCIPNKTRNVSSILVQSQENGYVLLDCGEGTLGQIQRMFGVAKAQDVVRNLKIIYISHLHADHHIGLIGLLTERMKLAAEKEEILEKVLVLAPKQIQPWLNFYQECIHNIKDSYELIGNADMLHEPLDLTKSHADLGICSITTCMVKHCAHSFGVKLSMKSSDETNQDPVTLTYSGDSMPCQDLIDLGQNSTILIHEATMEDDLAEEAQIKMHSTISQAIQQGKAMNAKHIILTHFSQRYAKLPRLPVNIASSEEDSSPDNENSSCCPSSMSNVSIAFDNMQISLDELQHFHLMYPVMRALFAEHAEELEQKALKRELKLERKRKLMTS